MDFLAAWVNSGTPFVASFQRACGVTDKGPTNPVLHAVFTFGASLGNEVFYITFLPWMMWFWSFDVFRRVVVFWAGLMYTGQLLKDIMRLPRPPHHLIVYPLESHYAEEYGMPSTHAMNAIGMAGYFCWLSADRFSGPAWVLPAVFTVWFVSCTLSRFYMGVHSPADVIAGLALGVVGLAVNLAVGDAVDAWILSSPHVWWVTPLTVAVLMLAYPRPVRPAWTSSPGDTAIIEGVVGGVVLGIYAHSGAHVAAVGRPIDFTGVTLQRTLVTLGASLLGFAILVAVRGVVKAITAPALLALLGPRYGPVEDLLTAAEITEAEKSEAAADAVKKVAAALPATRVAQTSDDADPRSASPRGVDASASASSTSATLTLAEATDDSHPTSSSVSSENDDSDPCNDAAAAPVSSAGSVRRRHATGTGSAASSDPTNVPRPVSASSTAIDAGALPAAPADLPPLIVGGPRTSGLVLLPPSRRFEIELPLKIITYAAVGFHAMYTVPLLFQWLGVAQYGM